MAMTRKDYMAIAQAIADAKHEIEGRYKSEGPSDYVPHYALRGIGIAARNVADVLKAGNPKFRYDTFLTACGFPEGCDHHDHDDR